MSHIFGVFSDKKFIKFNANAMKDQQSIEEEIKALAKCRDMKRKLLEARNQKPKVTFKTDKAGNIEVSPSAPCNSPEENSSDTDSIGDHADLLQRSSDSDMFDDALDYDKIKADGDSDSDSDDRTEEDHATVDGAIAKAIEKKNLQTVFHISHKGEDGIPVTLLPPSRRASAGSKQAAKATDEESSLEISDKERRQAQSNSKEEDEASKSSSSSTPSVVFIERSRLSIPSMLSFSDRATDVDDAADDEDTSSTETGDDEAASTIVIQQPAEIHISDGSSSSLKRPAPNKESRSSLGNQYDLVSSCLSVSANKAQALEDARPPRLAENSVIRTSCHVHAQGLGNKRASFIALIKGDSKETVSLNEGAEQDGKSQITNETDRESIQTLDSKEVESAEKLAESLISKALYEKPNEEATPKLIVQKPKQIKPLTLKEVQARVNRKNKGKLQIHLESFVKPPADIERDQKHELKKQRMAELKERNEFLKQLFPKAAIDFVDSDEDDFEVEPVPSSMAMMTHKLITLEMHAEQNANFLKQLNDRIAALEPVINENNPSEPNKVSSEEQDLLRLIDDTEVMFYEMDSLQPKYGEFMYMMNDSEVERDAKTLERKETINLGETLEHKEHVLNKMQALRKRIKAGGDGTVIDELTPSPKLQERFKSNKPRRSSEVTIKLSS